MWGESRTQEKLSSSRHTVDKKAIHIQIRSSLQEYFSITEILKKRDKTKFYSSCPLLQSDVLFLASVSKTGAL